MTSNYEYDGLTLDNPETSAIDDKPGALTRIESVEARLKELEAQASDNESEIDFLRGELIRAEFRMEELDHLMDETKWKFTCMKRKYQKQISALSRNLQNKKKAKKEIKEKSLICL